MLAVLTDGDAFDEEAYVDSVAKHLARAGVAYPGVNSVRPILAGAKGGIAAFVS